MEDSDDERLGSNPTNSKKKTFKIHGGDRGGMTRTFNVGDSGVKEGISTDS